MSGNVLHSVSRGYNMEMLSNFIQGNNGVDLGKRGKLIRFGEFRGMGFAYLGVYYFEFNPQCPLDYWDYTMTIRPRISRIFLIS